MKKRGIPVVYYVAPQFWAWRQGRVRLIRNYIDKALVIFPFEEKFYRDRGVDATFVGHPLAELAAARNHARRLCRTISARSQQSQWITLMPGSRVKEVRMNLPTILEAAARLGPTTSSCCRSRQHWTARSSKLDSEQTQQAAHPKSPRSRIPARAVSLPRRHRRQRHRDG